MTTTHALVPLAAAIAFARPSVSRRLLIVAAVAAALPDIDGALHHFWPIFQRNSVYSHRGATHSLFVAVLVACIAAAFHKALRVRALTAGVVVGASMASHGILDMMTDSGRPVAYLWPLSWARLFADWRPIHTIQVHWAHLFSEGLARLRLEMWQIIIPMFAAALIVRLSRLFVSATATAP